MAEISPKGKAGSKMVVPKGHSTAEDEAKTKQSKLVRNVEAKLKLPP
jgi:hypothetical protein